VASNLQKRLDKIERGLQQFLEAQNPSGPIYLSEGEPAPEGRDAIRIVMRWVEAEPQAEDGLEDIGSGNTEQRKTPLTLPFVESAAEREKRWEAHLRAIDARGDRYQGEESGGLSETGRNYQKYGVI
jgi:hypothetical protein